MSVRSVTAKGLVAHVQRRVARTHALRAQHDQVDAHDAQTCYTCAVLRDLEQDLETIRQLVSE